MITIRDFMFLCTEANLQEIELWDCDTEETEYQGSYYDMPKKYEDKEVQSWSYYDDGVICINI